jgi:hypothetical protein
MRRQRYGHDWRGGKAPRSGVFTRRAPRSQSSSDHAVKPSFVMRNGERIETYTMVIPSSAKPRAKAKKKFEAQFVQLPTYWIKQLHRSSSASTIKLAHHILVRAFECEHRGGEIVLSTESTRLSRKARFGAVRELVKLGLIEVEHRGGHQAIRVTNIIKKKKE